MKFVNTAVPITGTTLNLQHQKSTTVDTQLEAEKTKHPLSLSDKNTQSK